MHATFRLLAKVSLAKGMTKSRSSGRIVPSLPANLMRRYSSGFVAHRGALHAAKTVIKISALGNDRWMVTRLPDSASPVMGSAFCFSKPITAPVGSSYGRARCSAVVVLSRYTSILGDIFILWVFDSHLKGTRQI